MPIGVYERTQQCRESLRKAKIGRHLSKKHRENIGKAGKGKHSNFVPKNKGVVTGEFLPCDNCGNIHYVYPYLLKACTYHFCNPQCQWHFMVGDKSSMYGNSQYSGENSHSYKDGRTKKQYYCKDCGTLLRSYIATYCQKCHRGERSHLWKGGITPLNKQIRSSFKNRQWRSDVFTRDDFTCQNCNQQGGKLNAHHIKPFAQIISENHIKTFIQAMECEELWNINNGITLCKDCHKTEKILKGIANEFCTNGE